MNNNTSNITATPISGNASSYSFDIVAIQGYIDEIRQIYNTFQKRYSNIDNDLTQILGENIWDSDTSNTVAISYKVIQSYYDSIYNDFEKIINYLEAIVANYELIGNLSFF